MKSKKQSRNKVKLVLHNDENPMVRLEPGMKIRVETVDLIGSDLDLEKLKKVGARLCGGTSYCLALVDIDPLFDPAGLT